MLLTSENCFNGDVNFSEFMLCFSLTFEAVSGVFIYIYKMNCEFVFE